MNKGFESDNQNTCEILLSSERVPRSWPNLEIVFVRYRYENGAKVLRKF